jgi:hypothetical protein
VIDARLVRLEASDETAPNNEEEKRIAQKVDCEECIGWDPFNALIVVVVDGRVPPEDSENRNIIEAELLANLAGDVPGKDIAIQPKAERLPGNKVVENCDLMIPRVHLE